MRLRAAQQLFLSYLALIALVVIALSIAADSTLRNHLTATAREDLRRELLLGRELYQNVPDLLPDSVADVLGALSERRVTIVAPDGTVLGDSRVPRGELAAVANHRDRPEIQAAARGELGHDLRISPTVGTEHLYLAVLTERGDVIRFALPTSELRAAVLQVQRTIVTVGALALLLAVLFSFSFSLLVTRPLRTLAGAARDMSGGNLERRVRMRRADELGDLADALNTLADELNRRLAQLEAERAETQALIDSMSEAVLGFGPDGTIRRANPAAAQIFGLSRDARGMAPEAVVRRPEFFRLVNRVVRGEAIRTTELSHGGKHLLASGHPLPKGGAVMVFLDVSELRRLEGVRRDFVANASHELKTPLTAIRGYSETLLDDDLPPALRTQFAETVKANADRLQRIVDDLLDLSRLESGGWRTTLERVNLDELVGDAWWSVAGSLGKKTIRFQTDIEDGCRMIVADPGALRQVFSNLFSNAARYTPDGGTIGVRASSSGGRRAVIAPTPGGADGVSASADRVVIEVHDSGSGIPSQHLSRIFERFYRVDPARSRVEGGTGLGLSIVKHLVEAHGGNVEAISELGQGTTIRFTLPRNG